jgi:branched-chain amino acid transport system ATP-binding protein
LRCGRGTSLRGRTEWARRSSSPDEATEGLAPLILTEIWRVIGQMRASGIATLTVDRDYRKVLARSDRALVLQKGQAVLQGRAADVAVNLALASYLGPCITSR